MQTGRTRLETIGLLAASTAACLLWSAFAGRDLSWDLLDYHFYSAYQLLGDRIGRDFMAGGAQVYLNPVAQLPFYLMVRAGWHSLLVASVLAAIHSLCLWCLVLISRRLLPVALPLRRWALCVSVLLGFLAPVYLFEVGSTFTDATSAVPVLAAVALLVGLPAQGDTTRLLWAGGLMGLAAGLKLTNLIFPAAALVFLCLAGSPRSVMLRRGLLFTAAAGAGFLVVEGPWALKLYREFGNPLFPMFNDWFRSPDYPVGVGLSNRFRPSSLLDALQLPWRMALPEARVVSEMPAPDLRFLLIAVALIVTGALWFWRRVQGRRADDEALDTAAPSAWCRLLAFFLLALALWLTTSANGRYGMPLQLLAGPVLVGLLVRLRASARVVLYGLAAVVLVQGLQLALLSTWRVNAVSWKPAWFDVSLPQALREEDAIFLSLDIQTASFLYPFLSEQAAFVNVSGQDSLGLDRPGGRRLAAMLRARAGRIRTLMPVEARPGEPESVARQRVLREQDAVLARLRLAIDPAACDEIRLRDRLAPGYPATTVFVSCRTRRLSVGEGNDARRRLLDAAFDRLERQCPSRFGNVSPVTDDFGTRAYRRYNKDDQLLYEDGARVWYIRGWRRTDVVLIGRTAAVASGQAALDCRTGKAVATTKQGVRW